MRSSRLPRRIVERLRREALVWDQARSHEDERGTIARLDEAEIFSMSRPAREPVSVRLDPRDIFLLKRLARRKGIPSSQLAALWLHELVTRESQRPEAIQ